MTMKPEKRVCGCFLYYYNQTHNSTNLSRGHLLFTAVTCPAN